MQIVGKVKLGKKTQGISTIRFSKDGKLLFFTDNHNDPNVYCYSSPSL
jgi:hypothetical protein